MAAGQVEQGGKGITAEQGKTGMTLQLLISLTFFSGLSRRRHVLLARRHVPLPPPG